MEVIDRYIYAVTQRLPEHQREDIHRELQSLIEDMLEERKPTGQASKEEVEEVLLELGPPNELAAKYRGYERYLDAKMKIKRRSPILGIFFTIVVMVICLYFSDLIGIWRNHDGVLKAVPFLNHDGFRNYLPLVWIVAALAIMKQIVRMIVHYRSSKLLAFHIVMTVITTTLLCIMFTDQALWNPHFIQDLTASNLLPVDGNDFKSIVSTWPRLKEWLVNAIVVLALLDIITESLAWYRAKSSPSSITKQKPSI